MGDSATVAKALSVPLAGIVAAVGVGLAASYTSPLRPRLYAGAWHEMPVRAVSWMRSPPRDVQARLVGGGILAASAIAGLGVSGALGYAFMRGGVARAQLRPRSGGGAVPEPIRAASQLHGDADWLGQREMRRLAERPSPDWGGVIYGAAVRPDLHPAADGGRAPLLVSTGESDAVNGLVFGGMGAGKTSGVFVPTLVHPRGWKGNVLANDPSGQLAALCADAIEAEGRRVLRIGPGRRGFDLFAGLDPADPHFEADAHALVETMGRPLKDADRSDTNGVFKEMARNMVVAQLADLLADPATPRADRTPWGLMRVCAVEEDELRGRLERIFRDSPSPLARMMAAPLWNAHPRSFNCYYSDVMADLKWLTIRRNADLVSDTSPGALAAEDFVDGEACAFLNLGISLSRDHPQIARCILGTILRRITREERALPIPLLLLLEERILFGDLPPLNTAWTQSRKWRVVIVEAWQSLELMRRTVGEAMAETMQNGVAFESYAAIKAETAAKVSKRLGTYTALAPSESSGTTTGGQGGFMGNSSTNTGTTLQPVPLATTAQLEGMPTGWQVVFVNGVRRPVLCRQARYYLRPELAAVVPQDAYVVA